MILEPLTACIEQAKERINQHGLMLRGSEALTRYVLIDPLLRALGWDTSDPKLVRPEYRDTGGIADYALMSGDRPAALLEAKKFGENLSQAIDQALYYCFRQRITYMVVSDGNQWELHDAFKRDDVDTSVIKVSLQHDTTQAAALKLLHFWQPNLGACSGITAPPAPVAVPIAPPTPAYAPPEPAPAAPIHMADASLPVSPYQPPAPVPPTPVNEAGWRPLTSISYQQGDKSPVGIRFNQADARGLKSWIDAWVQVCEWAVATGRLTAADCPVPRPSSAGVRVIVHTAAEHPPSGRNPGGRGFKQPRKISNGLFIETNFSPSGGISNAKFLLERVGVNPSDVDLLFQ